MGIIHLASLGTNPGAVTSALSYLKHNEAKFTGFKGSIIESIIVFTSPEIRDGSIYSVKEIINNDYGSLKGPGWSCKDLTVLSVIKSFVEKELASIIPAKGHLSVCVVDHNDYDDCFKKIAKTVLRLSSNPKVGKHIWANLTGGTNILNAALLEVALLSGRISRLYYTFLADVQKYGKFLQPPSNDRTIFDWREIPFVKTNFDENYYEVLKVLNEAGEWCEDSNCLNRLKNKALLTFKDLDIQSFRRIYLNRMDGREIERDGNKNRLSEYGREILGYINAPWFRSLISWEESENEVQQNLLNDLNIEEELWCKS